ncbi:hypothetical protein BJI67_06405 [Acidihalobacter aeolianus]|uniref:YdhG-like domain-containing protein n=1 Tax=Acidihalobacter aeolianus TaxID=2792603 RepID=A0A1D8K702_9GAMM|nr:YdeI/OmpD-associated family protein [Acidihalobacter aeolianus]AOV16743.1 hypothetical protein BJI67_06405 [Acidihalobacter aeolianus]
MGAFLDGAGRWREEMPCPRTIALDCGLDESLKWGKPCYSLQDGNVAIVQPFKHRCAFMFFKGVLLDDPEGQLERPGEHSHAARRLSAGLGEIAKMEPALRGFIANAIEVERAGRTLPERRESGSIPEDLAEAFVRVPGLEQAFSALTPGRQRASLLYFADAKRAATRLSRVEKCVPGMLAGKGMND